MASYVLSPPSPSSTPFVHLVIPILVLLPVAIVRCPDKGDLGEEACSVSGGSKGIRFAFGDGPIAVSEECSLEQKDLSDSRI